MSAAPLRNPILRNWGGDNQVLDPSSGCMPPTGDGIISRDPQRQGASLHVRNRRLHGPSRRGPDPPGGPAQAGIPRVRQRRRGDARRLGPAQRPQEGRPGPRPGRMAGAGARPRHLRHGPHPMGDSRPADRPQRAPARRRRRRGRRRPQRGDREPLVAAQGTRSRRLSLRHPDRHRGRRPPDRPRAEGRPRLRPVRRRPEGLASPGRDLRAGRRQPEFPRPDRRGPVGEPPGRRGGRGGALPRLRLLRHRAPHGERGLSARRRGRAAHPRRLRDPPPRARADHAEDRPHRLEARRRRAGRLRPLHAEGDPRAARHREGRLARPPETRRGHRPVRRIEPHVPPVEPRPPHRLRGLRHELARGAGGRIPDREAGAPAGRGRIRQRIPLSQRPAG